MSRARALLSTWYLGIGAALAAAGAAAAEPASRSAVALAAAVLIVPAALVAGRPGGVRRSILAALTVAALTGVAGRLALDGRSVDNAPLPVALGVVGLALTAVVAAGAAADRQRWKALLGDAGIVALGSWVTAWVLISQPLADRVGERSLGVIVHSLQQPAASVALYLAAIAVLARPHRSPAVWMLGSGITAIASGALMATLADVGHVGDWASRWTLTLTSLGLFAIGAAVVHPTSAAAFRHGDEPRSPTARLVLTTSFLIAPTVSLAATGPDDTTDRVVRAVAALVLAGVVIGRVAAAVRANSRHRAELIHDAQTDPLTGLANRTVLIQRTNDLLRTSWNQDLHPTMFFIDVDRFKNINDSLGHAAGDEVLMAVARRLRDALPDDATVARMSGDEYAVLHPSLDSHAASMAQAEQLLALFREPLTLSSGDVFITVSVGAAAINLTTTTSPDDLVRHAHTAMYRAKDSGRNCVAVYDESMHERVAHRLAVETALYRALDRRELRLYHQPILDLRTGDVVGFEALMRWQKADGGMVSPAEFIPIAEETGTIVPIGAWALLEALTTLQQWIAEGVCSPEATMSVNVSPRQLSDASFPSVVSEALTRSGASPHSLWLEVTESVMISEPEVALATLRKLRGLGVRVAMDDFGTGYSSLSLLQKFPLQRLKIDRAFVQGLADNPNDRSLVRTIVAMGSSLGLDMVAEGVESVHQLQVLSDLGCHKAQGYLISHPVPPEAMRSTVSALERLGRFPGLRVDAALG
ncbi:MAG: hypothetical protein RLY45_938 [Actinomycetota bacterium]|jgi:diguanylate cyclase (GGDEF)-like protein